MEQINPQLLEEWKKEGELLTIFRCPRCFNKIPFYKTNNELINAIYITWARNHEYCPKCEKIRNRENTTKKKVPRIIAIIEKYDLVKISEDDADKIMLSNI